MSSHSGSMWEFSVPLVVNEDKVLAGIRLEDQNSGLKYNPRGLSIYGATATVVVPEPAVTVMGFIGIGLLLLGRKRSEQ